MDPNTLRRLNWLWKHRHKHDADTLQEQITIIKQTIESLGDTLTQSPGAHSHVLRTTTQSIAATGAKVAWDTPYETIGLLGFPTPAYPTTELEFGVTGYYDIQVILGWDSFTGGGSVTIRRIRNGVEVDVWPPTEDPGVWSAAVGDVFVDEAPGIPFEAGDKIAVWLDPDDASAQDLAVGILSIRLLDGEGASSWDLVAELTDNWGITWDGSGWWTSDATESANPALFDRDRHFAAENSYAGWDTGTPAPINTSLVFAEAFLWGTGQDDDDAVSKIDPADGSVDATILSQGSGMRGYTGIGYDGATLFVADQENSQFEEYSTAGVHQGNHAFPTGHAPNDIAWDGTGWWAVTLAGEIIQMDASFGFINAYGGPPFTTVWPASVYADQPYGGCEWKDGYLYVVTRAAVWRRRFA